MDEQERMSAKEFDSQVYKLADLQSNTIELARLILVEGKSATEAARIIGTQKQNVSKKMQRVRALLRGYPASWVLFNGMMPESMAVEIRSRVEKLLEKRKK